MVSSVSGTKLSSVVPAKDTGNKDHELSNMDLALKLHYIKGVYFFSSEAVRGLTIDDLKKPMFKLLQLFYTCSGRIRRSGTTGRPFIKCNDGGVRIVEAFCDEVTVDEWLQMKDGDSRDDCLAYDHVLGPDLEFSPLVFVQFTWFKCGGLSLGLSWAHVLGDPFSASAFINVWGQIMSGQVPPKSIHVPLSMPNKPEETPTSSVHGIKRVDPVGDLWQVRNNCCMKTHTFNVNTTRLGEMLSKAAEASHFELLSAVIWKSLSKVKGDSGPGLVTICRSNNNSGSRENEMPANDLVMATSTVETDFNVAECEVSELALLIADKREHGNCSPVVDGEICSDFIMYGANLTFVNMEEADVYGLKLEGQKPVFVNYTINGVGEKGAVLVLPGPEEAEVEARSASGCVRTVSVVLPEDQLEKLKNELKQEWDIV